MVELIDSVDTIHDLAPRLERRPFRLGLGTGLRWRFGCLAADLAMLALSGVATVLGAGAAGIEGVSAGWTYAYCALAFGLLAARGLYGSSFGLRTADDLRRVAGATGLAAIVLLALAAVVGGSSGEVDQTLRLWLFSTVYVGAGRVALNWTQRRARIAGEGLRPRSSSEPAGSAASRRPACRTSPSWACARSASSTRSRSPHDGDVSLPVLGASWDLERVVREHGVRARRHRVLDGPRTTCCLGIVDRCDELGVTVSHGAPPLREDDRRG